jgi:hypothetical protein
MMLIHLREKLVASSKNDIGCNLPISYEKSVKIYSAIESVYKKHLRSCECNYVSVLSTEIVVLNFLCFPMNRKKLKL